MRKLNISNLKTAQAKFITSKKGIVSAIYRKQLESSKKRNHRYPEYTKSELKEWLYSQIEFHELYNEWVNSGYLTRLKPSVDRKISIIHYCMSNIQLCTFEENQLNNGSELSKGGGDQRTMEVHQYSLDGYYIASFHSQAFAGKSTSCQQSKISEAIKGNRKTTGGFLWRDFRVENLFIKEEG